MLGEWNLKQFWNITSGIYDKYHVQIMLLFVYTTTCKRFVIFRCMVMVAIGRWSQREVWLQILTQNTCKLPTLAVTFHSCQADQHPAINQSCCLILFQQHTNILLRHLNSSYCVQYSTTTHTLYLWPIILTHFPQKNTAEATVFHQLREYIPFLLKLNKQLLPSDYVEQQHANNCNLLR